MHLEEHKPIEKLPKKIVKNTVYNIIGNFTLILMGFILVPYIIKHIGINVYGNVWVIAIIIISFSQLFDFGFGSACTKFIAEYYTKFDFENLNKVLNTSFFFFLLLWIIIFPLILYFESEIIQLIGTPVNLKDEMYFVLIVIVGLVAMNHITSPFYASIHAIQRFELLNISVIIGSLINVSLIVLFFNLGYGVKGVAVSYFVFYLIIALTVVIYSFKLIPGLRFGIKFFSLNFLKKLFYFGTNLQISRIAQIFVFQFDKFFVLKFFGGNYSAFYEIGTKITGFARSIPLLLVSAVVPAASELDAKGENSKLKILFETGTRYLIIGGFFMSGFIFSNANLIIQTWVGKKLTMEGINIASSVIRVIVFGFFANTITGAMSSVAVGFDRTDIERRAGIAMIIAFPVFMLLLFPILGFYGIALSVALSILISAIYLMKQFLKVVDYKSMSFLKMLLKPFVATVLSILLTYMLYQIIPQSFLENRLGGFLALLFLFIAYTITYFATIILSKSYEQTDLTIIKMFLNGLRRIKITS